MELTPDQRSNLGRLYIYPVSQTSRKKTHSKTARFAPVPQTVITSIMTTESTMENMCQYGSEYEKPVGKRLARSFLDDHGLKGAALPKMGYTTDVVVVKDKPFDFYIRLELSNISGRFFIRSSGCSRGNWRTVFKVAEKYA